MATYSYTALNAEGKLVKGFLEGDSGRQVRQQLRSQQLKPVQVDLASGAPGFGQWLQSLPSHWFKTHLNPKDLALLTRQLATLVQANIPLDEALVAAAKQYRKPKVQSLLMQLRTRVVEGHTLAYALGDFPQVFNDMYRSMVAAGEHAGYLGSVLSRLADYTENGQHTQQKLKAAMVYPVLLTIVAISVVAVLMILVVPQLIELFARTNRDLPGLTLGLIAVSDFVVAYWWLIVAILIVSISLIRFLLRDPGRQKAWHRFLLKLPICSAWLTAIETARFASTLSILTASGVPLLEGLRIAGSVMENRHLREGSEKVADKVQEGSSLHRALEKSGLFPPMMVQMVASGEASGELETMLARSAINQEREVEMTLETLMSIFTPLLIVIMAGVVATIVMAILLPIIQMNQLVA